MSVLADSSLVAVHLSASNIGGFKQKNGTPKKAQSEPQQRASIGVWMHTASLQNSPADPKDHPTTAPVTWHARPSKEQKRRTVMIFLASTWPRVVACTRIFFVWRGSLVCICGVYIYIEHVYKDSRLGLHPPISRAYGLDCRRYVAWCKELQQLLGQSRGSLQSSDATRCILPIAEVRPKSGSSQAPVSLGAIWLFASIGRPFLECP